ncbi:MAG: hypothetical protein V4449_03240 [Patescibacteria group bacterium]
MPSNTERFKEGARVLWGKDNATVVKVTRGGKKAESLKFEKGGGVTSLSGLDVRYRTNEPPVFFGRGDI